VARAELFGLRPTRRNQGIEFFHEAEWQWIVVEKLNGFLPLAFDMDRHRG